MLKKLAKPDEVWPRSISSSREEWLDSSLNNIAGKETGQTQDLNKWESKAYLGKGKWPIMTAGNAKSKNGRGDNSGVQSC